MSTKRDIYTAIMRTNPTLYTDAEIEANIRADIQSAPIIASNRSESEPTAEEWAIAEQRAGEARMDTTNEE